MKKILLIFVFFISINCVFAREETPLLLDTPITTINYVEDDYSLINIQNMKKQDKVEKARDELNRSQTPKIKLDTREINHQRALDYTTRPSNSMMLPVF